MSHYAALFSQQGDALRWAPVCRWRWVPLYHGMLGLLASWLVVVQKIKGRAALDALSLMPAALPGIVVGSG
jgi:iron(III) transport system permease protein